MKRRFLSVAVLASLALVVAQTCVAADEAPPAARKKGESAEGRTTDLTVDLKVLNQCEKQPEAVRERYLAARNVFSAKRDATYAELIQDEAFRTLCDRGNIDRLGGPMLGCIAPDGAKVWVRTVRPAQVEVQVEGVAKAFGPVASTVESDLAAVVAVTGLTPGGRYAYKVLIDGTPIDMPGHAAIVTPSDAKTAKTRIAFGTCPHRWGLGNAKQAEQIRGRQPAALLIYGDVAVQDRYNHLGMHRADYFMRDSFAAWRDLVCTVPVYVSWDDHDYFGNDLAGIPKGFTDADRKGVRDVFRSAWVNPAYGAKDDGIYFRTRVGPCDVILLDTRYFRTGKKGSFLGDDQMAWLEEQLLDCKGPFIILSSGTMWSDYVSGGKDSWGRNDPAGRERIFALIEEHRIPGVLLVSGDRHGARGFRIPRPSGYTFYEFEPASLGARTGPEVTKPEWQDVQLFGIDKQYAFGEFEFDLVPADPAVTIRLIHEDGQALYEQTLSRSDLSPK